MKHTILHELDVDSFVLSFQHSIFTGPVCVCADVRACVFSLSALQLTENKDLEEGILAQVALGR